jgi:hypothetical protein
MIADALAALGGIALGIGLLVCAWGVQDGDRRVCVAGLLALGAAGGLLWLALRTGGAA